MKTCTRCGIPKSFSSFYRLPNSHDGLRRHCKQCYVEAAKIWRGNNLERARETSRLAKRRFRKRVGAEEIRRKAREYYAQNAEHRRKYENERRDSKTAKAHGKINREIRAGRLTRPDHCSQCGEERKVIAHHEDYDKPLEVDWLCRKCHALVHGIYIV